MFSSVMLFPQAMTSKCKTFTMHLNMKEMFKKVLYAVTNVKYSTGMLIFVRGVLVNMKCSHIAMDFQ